MANDNNYLHANFVEYNESCPLTESNNIHLRVLQWNIRGMNDLHKFDSILEMLELCRLSIDVICISETWLKRENVVLYNIPGFNSIFSCRDASNGGLVVYVKSNLPFTVKSNAHTDGFHHIHIEISINKRLYDVHGFYRPPSYDVNSFLAILENVLDNSNSNRSCFLVGDINIPMNLFSNNVVVKYRSLLESYGFACSNTIPTRPISSNILDHTVCRIDDLPRIRNDTILTDQSDHCMVLTSFTLLEEKHRTTLVKTIVDHQKINDEFKNYLNAYGEVQDANSCLTDIISTYKTLHDRYSRIITKNVSIKGDFCPWMTLNLWHLIKIKNNYIKRIKRDPNNQHLKNMLKHVSDKLISGKKNCKRLYYENLLNNTPHSKLWTHINRIFGKKSKPNSIVLVKNGVNVDNKPQVCEIFNEYFSNIGRELANSITVGLNSNPLSHLRRVSNSVFLTPASTNEVTLLINGLVSKKSVGPDGLKADVIKANSITFSRILSQIFNKIIETGVYPDCLKVARVVPVFKSGDANDVSNYRPISTLSTFNKILEKLLINRLVPFLNQHNILYKLQYGFRQGSSTETAVSELLDDVIKGIDSKKLVGALFLDLRKAFDTLDHTILLKKLDAYGIRGIANEIICSYLTNRKQYVSIDDSVSSFMPITVGVPQGSNIGPLLFLLYINDLGNIQLKGVPRLFADDTALFYPRCDIETVVADINEDLRILSKYLASNLLSLNLLKTKYMVFRSPRKLVQNNIAVTLNSCVIEKVDSFKYLGLYLDETLCWSEHIRHVEKKVTSLCSILRKVSSFLPRNILLKFYFAHIHSAFNYLIIAWGRACKSHLKKLQTLQNRCLKTVFGKPFLFPSLQLYSDSTHSILPINGLCELQTALFVYDTLHRDNFHHNVQMPSISHRYSTRRPNNLHQSRACTALGQKRISIVGPIIYNKIPDELKQITNRHTFKKKLKQHYKLHVSSILG